MRSKEVPRLFMVIGLILSLILTGSFLACAAPPGEEEEEEEPETEIVADIPLPWLFWNAVPGGISAMIEFSNEYTEPVVIAREWATLPVAIALNNLTWDQTEDIVTEYRGEWMGSDENPVLIAPDDGIELVIPITEEDVAVLVRYGVAWDDVNWPDDVQVRISAATILSSYDPDVPSQIEAVLHNFDVINDTGRAVNNLDLRILGGVVAQMVAGYWDYPSGPFQSWGTPPQIINLVANGIAVVWEDKAHPLNLYDQRHFGIWFNYAVGLTSVYAYWTWTS
jgi:hypothetical protein